MPLRPTALSTMGDALGIDEGNVGGKRLFEYLVDLQSGQKKVTLFMTLPEYTLDGLQRNKIQKSTEGIQNRVDSTRRDFTIAKKLHSEESERRLPSGPCHIPPEV